MRRRIAAALFDCDGVLVNSEPIHWIAERESLRALGIVVTAAEQEGYVGLSQSELWERVKRKHGLALGAADLVSMHSDRLHRLMSQCPVPPVAGVAGFIEFFTRRQVRIGAVTSSPQSLFKVMIRNSGLPPVFETVVSGDDVEVGKPDPAPFLLGALQLGVDPEQTLVIEDSEHGVLAAKQAGMTCLGFRNPDSGLQDLSRADFVGNTMEELAHYVLEVHFQGSCEY
jgi:beta-phosphoglucomutase-like phosphatase (HAD superfamily)